METVSNKCVNCDSEIRDNFCSHCGQRVGVKRITLKESWFDFWSRVYGFDGMFPRTIRDLTLRPGTVAQKIISGNRVKYYGPVGYFFLMVTLFIVIAGLLNVDIREFLSQKQNTIGNFTVTGEGQDKINEMVRGFISDNLRLIAFMVIPFTALIARYIMFRKSGLNYLEHAVLPLYLIGHSYWLNILSIIMYSLSGMFILNSVNSFILIAFFGFGYTGLIVTQSKIKSFIKGIFVFILGQISLIITLVIVAVIVIFILYKVNPEALELIRPSNNR